MPAVAIPFKVIFGSRAIVGYAVVVVVVGLAGVAGAAGAGLVEAGLAVAG